MKEQVDLNTPMLSVVIPVYNAQRSLPVALQSVLSQGVEDIEIILINDGSRDNSLAVCQDYAARDSRIKVLDQPNGGPGAARNTGLAEARGEFISFVDSDDTLLPGSYQRLLAAAGDGSADLVIAHFNILINGQTLDRGYVMEDCSLSRDDFLSKLAHRPGSYYYSALWNKLYRRQILADHSLAFDSSYNWGEDFDFNMRFYRHVERVAFSREPIYLYERTFRGQTWRTMIKLAESCRIKARLYRQLKALYRDADLWDRYRLYIYRYIFNVTVST